MIDVDGAVDGREGRRKKVAAGGEDEEVIVLLSRTFINRNEIRVTRVQSKEPVHCGEFDQGDPRRCEADTYDRIVVAADSHRDLS